MQAARISLGVAIVAAAVGSWAMGCSSSSPVGAAGAGADGGDGDGGAGGDGPGSSGLTVLKLVQNSWDTSHLNAAIAKILLTEQLGMTVEVTELARQDQWASIASGDEHVSLEVWPSSNAAQIADFVDTNKVENGGPLGAVAKVSWYVPTYLLTANPALASYQAYKDSATTAAFQAPDTGNKGRFLAGNPAWTQYDSDIIKNLGLNLQVDYAGSEGAELAELDAVYAKRGAILLYLWSPHSALAKYDLTAVQLPAYDPNQYANAANGAVACDYPTDKLFKILWPGLKTANAKVYQFFKSFTLTTKDQIGLLDAMDNKGQTVDQAARAWVDANNAIWQTWIPK